MIDLVNLTDRTIVVTGASSGIGRQTAITLSQLGARVVLVARREDKLREVLSDLEGEGHGYRCADLSRIDEIEDVVKGIVEEFGSLDGLVHAAGIALDLPLKQYKPEKVEKEFRINFFSFIELVRQATARGRYNKGMRIVGISSIAAFKGAKAHAIYSASKAAMDGAVRCLAKELESKNICLNTVAPGMVRTEMYDVYLERSGGAEGRSNKGLLSRQYRGIIPPEDVAVSIAFLISPAARYITGICLPVDGGYLSN